MDKMSERTLEDTELDEDALLNDRSGRKIHLLCCRSDFMALCGHLCEGNKVHYATPLTCGGCVEKDELSESPRPCLSDPSKCLAKSSRDNEKKS